MHAWISLSSKAVNLHSSCRSSKLSCRHISTAEVEACCLLKSMLLLSSRQEFIFLFSHSKNLNLPMCHQIVFECLRVSYILQKYRIQRLLEANLNIHESFSTKYENFFVVFPNELISHPCCEQEYNVTYVSRRTSHFALNFKIMHLI